MALPRRNRSFSLAARLTRSGRGEHTDRDRKSPDANYAQLDSPPPGDPASFEQEVHAWTLNWATKRKTIEKYNSVLLFFFGLFHPNDYCFISINGERVIA